MILNKTEAIIYLKKLFSIMMGISVLFTFLYAQFLDNLFFLIWVVFFIFFTISYSTLSKVNNLNKFTHIFSLTFIFLVLTATIITKNTALITFNFLLVPLVVFTILTKKIATTYLIVLATANSIIPIIYNSPITFIGAVQLNTVGVLACWTFYFLLIRNRVTRDELSEHIERLENKIERSIKNEKEKSMLLGEVSKMATLGELLSSIVHQLKQPLASIGTIGSKMRFKEEVNGKENTPLIKDIKKIELQTSFMVNTMNDLKSFTSKKSEK